MTTLTPAQGKVLELCRSHQEKFGTFPSTRYVQKSFGFASQTAAQHHLLRLEAKGFISKAHGRNCWSLNETTAPRRLITPILQAIKKHGLKMTPEMVKALSELRIWAASKPSAS